MSDEYEGYGTGFASGFRDDVDEVDDDDDDDDDYD